MPYFSRHGGWSRKVNESYRSGLEERVIDELNNAGAEYSYEKHRVDYTSAPVLHHYTPDFVLGNGIIVETKGLFSVADRQKHLLIQKQHPDLDIRFVFSNSRTKIRKGSKTSYGDWCKKHGFVYADKYIPLDWLSEPKKGMSEKDIYVRGGKREKD